MADSKISQLSPTTYKDGLLIPAIDTTLPVGTQNVSLAASALLAPAVSPPITRQATFDQAIVGMTQVKDFVFGTTVVPTSTQIKIGSIANLTTYFLSNNPGTKFSINSEVQRYQDFNTTNFAFTTNKLNIAAVLDTSKGYTGSYAAHVYALDSTVSGVVLDGVTANPISRLGWANTTGIGVGTIVIFEWAGTYYVKAISVNNTVTLAPLAGSGAVTVSWNLNMVTPYTLSTNTAAVGNGSTVIPLAYIPAGLVPGMMMAFESGPTFLCRTQDFRVTAINGLNVTVSPALSDYGTLPIGTNFTFGPPITSGQLISIDTYDLTQNDGIWAFDLYCSLPTDSTGGYSTRYVQDGPGYAAVPADHPWGCWPAFWLFSVIQTSTWQRDTSEIDMVEMFYDITCGTRNFTGANHGPGAGGIVFSKTSNGYADDGNGGNLSNTSLSGNRRFSGIITANKTRKYVDGILVSEQAFSWTSQEQAVVIVNLAMGSLAQSLSNLLLLPQTMAGIANSVLGVSRLRIFKTK